MSLTFFEDSNAYEGLYKGFYVSMCDMNLEDDENPEEYVGEYADQYELTGDTLTAHPSYNFYGDSSLLEFPMNINTVARAIKALKEAE